jgi:hypothetical protein
VSCRNQPDLVIFTDVTHFRGKWMQIETSPPPTFTWSVTGERQRSRSVIEYRGRILQLNSFEKFFEPLVGYTTAKRS